MGGDFNQHGHGLLADIRAVATSVTNPSSGFAQITELGMRTYGRGPEHAVLLAAQIAAIRLRQIDEAREAQGLALTGFPMDELAAATIRLKPRPGRRSAPVGRRPRPGAHPRGRDRRLSEHRDPRRRDREPAGRGGPGGAVRAGRPGAGRVGWRQPDRDLLAGAGRRPAVRARRGRRRGRGPQGGPRITRADLLVDNKTDLAPHVGVDAELMVREGLAARDRRPVVALSRTDDASVDRLRTWVLALLERHRSGEHDPVDPGPMAPHSHQRDVRGHAHSH